LILPYLVETNFMILETRIPYLPWKGSAASPKLARMV